jgi:hypothetical protein
MFGGKLKTKAAASTQVMKSHFGATGSHIGRSWKFPKGFRDHLIGLRKSLLEAWAVIRTKRQLRVTSLRAIAAEVRSTGSSCNRPGFSTTTVHGCALSPAKACGGFFYEAG